MTPQAVWSGDDIQAWAEVVEGLEEFGAVTEVRPKTATVDYYAV